MMHAAPFVAIFVVGLLLGAGCWSADPAPARHRVLSPPPPSGAGRAGHPLLGENPLRALTETRAASAARPASSGSLFPVEFRGPGALSGHAWSVTISNQTIWSNTSAATVWLPNGSYSYSVSPPVGWTDSTPNGTVNLSGVPTGLITNLSQLPTSLGLLADPSNGQLYVTNTSSPYLLDARNRSTGKLLTQLSVGRAAFAPLLSPAADLLFVVSNNNGTVTAINPSSDTVDRTMVVGQASWFLGLDPTRNIIYTPNAGTNNVTEIGAENATSFGSISTDPFPGAAVPVPALDRLFVVTFAYSTTPSEVEVFDLGNGTVAKRITLSLVLNPEGAVYDPQVGELFVPDSQSNHVYAINVTSLTIDHTILLPSGEWPTAPILDPLNGMLYAGLKSKTGMAIIDPVSNAYVTTVSVPGRTFEPAFDPVNGGIWSTDTWAGGAEEIEGTPTTVVLPMVPPPPHYNVTFQETGLPSGTLWSVTAGNVTNASRSGAIGFSELNGSYSFTLGFVPGYRATTERGSFLVSGAAITVPIAFAATLYLVAFTETGLPPGTQWSVTFNGTTEFGIGSTISVPAANGSYGYSFNGVRGYEPPPPPSTVLVQGRNVTLAVTFVALTGAFTVTFLETGLRSGTGWSVRCNATTETSTTGAIVFLLPVGSYSYDILPVGGYAGVDTAGQVYVLDHNQTIPVQFVAALPRVYSVAFQESGLPANQDWRVELNGTWSAWTGAGAGPVSFTDTNGSYAFTISTEGGFTASPAQGSIDVVGANVTTDIEFTANASGPAPPPAGPAGLTTVEWGALAGVLAIAVGALVLFARRRSARVP